jgi:hypothetical protein
MSRTIESTENLALEEAGRYEDVILEEARRAITFQAAGLDELRARTGVLLAAAAVSASFLGSAAAENGTGLGFWGGAALIFFALGVWSCMVVLLPKRDGWTFVTSPALLIEDWITTSRPESMQLFLAKSLEENYDQNAKLLATLFSWFAAAAICIGASVVLGCIQLSSS